jgi:hypothetical protein
MKKTRDLIGLNEKLFMEWPKTLNEPNKVLIFIVENMENNYFGVFWFSIKVEN